jgi:hypothetical protein
MTERWTEAWAEAQASVPANIVELFCIELIHPAFVDAETDQQLAIRAVNDMQDHDLPLEETAYLDPGETVTFKAVPFKIFWPEIEEGTVPELTLSIDNVGREIMPYVEAATRVNAPLLVIARVYLLDMATGIASAGIDPIEFKLRSVTITETTVEGKASPGDLANLRGMALVYDLQNYPGLDIVNG